MDGALLARLERIRQRDKEAFSARPGALRVGSRLGFRAQDLGVSEGLYLRAWGLRSRIWSLGLKIEGLLLSDPAVAFFCVNLADVCVCVCIYIYICTLREPHPVIVV